MLNQFLSVFLQPIIYLKLISNLCIDLMNKCKKTGVFKFSLILSIVLVGTFSGNAQNTPTSSKDVLSTKESTTSENKVVQNPIDSTVLKSKPSFNQKDIIYPIADKMPQFPGGENALYKYIRQHLRYPRIPYSYGIEGKVTVWFVVNSLGKVDNVEVIIGVDPDLDFEAERVISSLPDFIPGQLEGKNVPVWYSIPITFSLHEGIKPAPVKPNEMPVFVMDGIILPKGYNTSTINRDSVTVKVFIPDTKAHRAWLISKYGKQAINGVVEITKKEKIKFLIIKSRKHKED